MKKGQLVIRTYKIAEKGQHIMYFNANNDDGDPFVVFTQQYTTWLHNIITLRVLHNCRKIEPLGKWRRLRI